MAEIQPRPVTTPEARLRAARGTVQREGFAEADVWLETIRRLAQKPATLRNQIALRRACAEFHRAAFLDY